MCTGLLGKMSGIGLAKRAIDAGPSALISPVAAMLLKKKMSGSAPMTSGPATYASSNNNNLPIPPKLGA